MNAPPKRSFGRWWLAKAATVDHAAILEQVADDGRLTARYLMMTGIAAGITTIGLLLNSPAVIIGAMLVSPLMGPIVLTGVALSTFDAEAGRHGALALLGGIVAALAVAGFIVLISPITDPTPEILARTRPNLFDLAVALLSGLAGGYATVRGRGGAAVGVAIATALMPPLAVVAYGTVLGQWAVARGASLLFITNMVAIAAAVAAVASWYGFARREFRRKLAGQTLVAGLLLVPLGIPLFHSLQAIAEETHLTGVAREVLQQLAVRENESRIETFQVSFPEGIPPRVDAVVLARELIPDLQARAEKEISARSERPVNVRVDQVRVAELRPVVPASAVANPVQAAPVAAPAAPQLAEAVRAAFPMPLAMVEVDQAARRLSVLPKPDPAYGLAALHRMEQELAARHPGWQVRVLPPQGPFERLRYPRGIAELPETERAKLDDIVWALEAWGVARVHVSGFASSDGDGPERLARTRAEGVAQTLQAAGIEASVEGHHPALGQAALERELGLTAFQAVEITPAR